MGTQLVEIREAIRQAMDEEMERDSNIIILGEEVAEYNGAYKVTKGMLDKWGPERILDTPISESAFTGMAIGAAMTGLRPIVEFMSFNFSFVAADQIISNAVKLFYMSGGRFNVPVVFRGPNGAAAQVSCQHSHCVESLYGNFPGLYIVSPGDAYDSKGLLKTAIRNNNPVLFLENELIYSEKMEIPEEEYLIPLGKAKVLQTGSDLTLIGYSRMLAYCKEAIQVLSKQGVSIELIDLRSLRPLDITTITESIRKTHHCVLVEEGHVYAGISAEIGFQIQERVFDFLDAPIERVCQKETPMPYSKYLERETLPNPERIIQVINKALNR